MTAGEYKAEAQIFTLCWAHLVIAEINMDLAFFDRLSKLKPECESTLIAVDVEIVGERNAKRVL